MRLHRLELRAIGPFASDQSVDFDELTASGLFLLDGPTGAGKTAVLDAITFALYGPGDRGGDDRLHSDFAAPGTEPRVRLEFSVRGVRHRITRSPEYDRPKRRGTGTTRAPAQAHLERMEPAGWVSRSSNKAEIGDLLADQIGLAREQFRQVVLLPQGEFARFLRSSDDDRRALLSRLFGTQLYDRITDELDRRRQSATRDLDAGVSRVASCVAAAGEAAGLDRDARDELCALAAPDRTARLAEIESALGARRADARAAVDAAEAAARNAQQSYERATADAALASRFGALQSQWIGHRAVADKVDEARAVLASALRAEPVRPLLDIVDRAASAVREAQDEAGEQPVADLERAIQEARARARTGEQAGAQRDTLLLRLSAAERVDALTPRLAAAASARAKAVDAHQSATAEHLRLVEVRLEGMAAELAAALRAGEPCAVCGSPEHPAPAPVLPGAVGLVQVRAAQQRRDEAERARRKAEERVAECERAVAAAAGIAADASVAELTHERAELDVVIAAAQQAETEVHRLVRAAELAKALAAARATHADAVAHANAEARAAGFDSLDEARRAVLAPDIRADLEQRVATWDATAATLDAGLMAAEFAELRSMPSAEVETLTAVSVRAADAARTVLEQADATRTAAVTAADRSQRESRRFGERRAELDEADAVLAALQAEVEPVLHLSRLTRGMAGQRRVALTTYVLRHWFAHVVQAANVRLGAISAGRYELLRVDEGFSRTERSGLTLQVVDRHTGEARSPRSLSGGETFYTSLALALGLADVVKAEAGGVDLDTLFIDEGFGTLDADTLEQVMTVIDDLRDRGRIVGVVSHVADLKERIPERLEVRRLPDGSSTLRVVA